MIRICLYVELIISLFSFIPLFGNAQEKFVQGYISDTSLIPVNNATVKLYQVNTDSANQLLGFYISRSNGFYSIALPHNRACEFMLSVFALGYKKAEYRFILANDSIGKLNHDFRLEESFNYLDTVRINSEFKMKMYGDTIIFNPRAFALGNESSIEQLLARFPGMNIDPRGKITFNGNAISSVLIDGDDLFQGNYTELTQNASPKILDSVAVIKNYQTDKLLKKAGITNGQVINLILKKEYKNYTTGYINAGYGIDNNRLENLFLLGLHPNMKIEGRLSNNTIGNVSANSNDIITLPLTKNNYKGNFTPYNPINAPINLGNLIAYNIPLNYQLTNETSEATGNIMVKGKNSLESNFNVEFSIDSIRQRQEETTNYINGISIQQRNGVYEKLFTQKYNADISKKTPTNSLYLNFNLKLQTTGNLYNTFQTLQEPSVQNLKSHNNILSVNGNYNQAISKRMLWVTQYALGYQNIKEEYQTNPDYLFWIYPSDTNFYKLRQNASPDIIHNFINTAFKTNGRRIFQSLEAGVTYDISFLHSDLISIDSNLAIKNYTGFLNNYKNQSKNIYLYYSQTDTLTQNSYLNFSLKNEYEQLDLFNDSAGKKISYFLPDYQFTYTSKLNGYNSVNLSAGYQAKTFDAYDYFQNEIMTRYRYLTSGYPYENTPSHSVYFKLSHSLLNLVKLQWLSFFNAQFSFDKNNFISNTVAKSVFQQYKYIAYGNTTRQLTVLYASQKLFPALNLSTDLNVFYNYKTNVYLNNDSLYKSNTNSTSVKLGWKSAFRFFLNFEINTSFLLSENNITYPLKTNIESSTFSQKAFLNLIFDSTFYSTLSYSYFQTNYNNVKSNNNFVDISINKSFLHKRFDIGLTGKNLLNEKKFKTNIVTPDYQQSNIIYLTGGQLYLTLKYVF